MKFVTCLKKAIFDTVWRGMVFWVRPKRLKWRNRGFFGIIENDK